MRDHEFEWDERKAAANHSYHRVTFQLAHGVFRDPLALDWADTRQVYGEARYATVGMVQGRVLYVAYTMRDDRIRIISARGAEPHEQRRYHQDSKW